MRKTFLLIALAATMVLGCGEAGVESDVSKITELSFSLDASDFTAVGGFLVADILETIDPAAEDFSEYLGDIQNYRINKLEMQISDYASTANDPVVVFIGLGANPVGNISEPNILSEDSRTSANTPLIDAVTNANDQLTNSDKILIYDRTNSGGSLIASDNAGLQQVLTALQNSTSFQGRAQLALQGSLSGSFTLTLFFDITARVELD